MIIVRDLDILRIAEMERLQAEMSGAIRWLGEYMAQTRAQYGEEEDALMPVLPPSVKASRPVIEFY